MSDIFFEILSGLPVLLIRDFYSELELNAIFDEIIYLSNIDIFKDATDIVGTGSALYEGSLLRSGKRISLDQVFNTIRSESNILKITRKLFKKETTDLLEKYHLFFKYLGKSSDDYTSLNYYTDGDYYKAHTDTAVITAISFFNIEPKGYKGGDFILEHKLKIPCSNNSLIVFPSIMLHEVTPIIMHNFDANMGRYSITQSIKM
tara:strand:- start:53 stop:664 length:612 start_codon:yes stop_codon:yes gene_type:complete